MSRTLTFLFTDIEGSTRLWERTAGDAQALERHDAILRAAREGVARAGREDDRRRVHGRLRLGRRRRRACITAQRSLARRAMGDDRAAPVRMGLHGGEAAAREGDYFGPTLNRAARIMTAGHGGQVLLSAAAAALVARPTAGRRRAAGPRRASAEGPRPRPSASSSSSHPGLPEEFPPLVDPRRRPSRLPEQPSAFVGREAEIAAIASASRTIVSAAHADRPGRDRQDPPGAAASPPTLSSRFAGRRRSSSTCRRVATARPCSAAIARAIGLDAPSAEPLLERARRPACATSTLLLVLDNFEQVDGGRAGRRRPAAGLPRG